MGKVIAGVFFLFLMHGAAQSCRQKPASNPGSADSLFVHTGLQPDGSLSVTRLEFRFTDSLCVNGACNSVVFLVPRAAQQAKVNALIDSAAIAAWGRYFPSFSAFSNSTFKELHEEDEEYSDAQTEPENLRTSLHTQATVLFNRHGLLSVRYDLESRAGDQLVMTDCAFLNLNTVSGTPLSIPDLLRPNSTDQFIAVAEEAFYSKYRFRLTPELEGCQLRFDRCRFILPEYFSFTESAIVLEYRPYELGPAWMGNPPIVIPFSQLQQLIDPAGPLAWTLQKPEQKQGLRQKWKRLKK